MTQRQEGIAPHRPSGSERSAAAALLSPERPPLRATGQRLLASARSLGYDLSCLWSSGTPPRVCCWIVPSAGRLGMLYAGLEDVQCDAAALAPVLCAACADARDRLGVLLVQALLEEADDPLLAPLTAAGMRPLAPLRFLRTALEPVAAAPPSLPEKLRVLSWRDELEADFLRALARSYEDSQDCPELTGLRPLEDVLASHKATGVFDPSLWWLLWSDAENAPVGVILVNLLPESASAELVYMGLAPEARGKGLARSLLERMTHALAQREVRELVCAVDSRNTPAQRLYAAMGFTRFASRIPLIRALS